MTATHYTRTAVALHWSIAGLIFAAVFMGWTMTEMAISPGKLKLYNYHKWVGVTVLALAVVRVLWKLTHRAPPLLPMPRWQQIAAHAGHGLLYVLMLAVPLSGWVYSNASGYPVVYLGKASAAEPCGTKSPAGGPMGRSARGAGHGAGGAGGAACAGGAEAPVHQQGQDAASHAELARLRGDT
jgi:cytochrome b561